jgi:hypothetical protein
MHRQTQTDRGSEHSSADHPKLMKAVKPSVATKRILREIFISNNTTEEEIVQEQSATKHNNATKSNNYSIMQMSKEDTMDKALKLQLSDNEVSDKVTKNSKSYLLEQQILADGYKREITSASKRQEGTSPKETIMFKSVQNNSTANRQRTNESNQYLYEEVTRETAEERTVVTKLMQLAANRPDESQTMMATLSKQEANDRTAFTANISKETSILSNIPAKITNKGIDQDEQLKRGEEPAEEMKEAKQEYPRRTQLSINEAYVNSNLNREVKSANDKREFNNLLKQQELILSEDSKMEEDNKLTAKFTTTETKNQKQDNKSTAKFTNTTETKNQKVDTRRRASYLLKDGKPQIQFNSAETKDSQHACTDESRQIQKFNSAETKGSQHAYTDESRRR